MDRAPGGTVRIGARTIARMGYGAMQLEHVAPETADAVLRRAVELGVNHLDTASFYGDATVNEHIRRALHPYPADLTIVSKVGARRVPGDVPLAPAQRPEQLRAQVHLDLRTLALEQLAAVNLRRMDMGAGIIARGEDVVPLDDQLAELVALRDEGLIGAVGLSNVSADQLRRALPVGIGCVQNAYNLLDRSSEEQLALCEQHGITWVPYFPLGSAFDRLPSPSEHPATSRVAADLGASPSAVALAWILAHAETGALIPGTRSLAHLEDNVAAADLQLPAEAVAALDAVASPASPGSARGPGRRRPDRGWPS